MLGRVCFRYAGPYRIDAAVLAGREGDSRWFRRPHGSSESRPGGRLQLCRTIAGRIMRSRLAPLAILALSIPARAAEPPTAGVAPMPVFPTSPAFDALGVNPTEVMRPS